MNDGELVVKFFSKLVLLTIYMNSSGKKFIELQKVEKLLRALISKFNYIAIEIE